MTFISPEDYLLGENDRADGEKYEYVNGQILPVSVEALEEQCRHPLQRSWLSMSLLSSQMSGF